MSRQPKIRSNVIEIRDLMSEPGATGKVTDYHDNTDPQYVGPGAWNIIHKRAFKARTRAEQLAFIQLMKDTCHDFPCFTCRGHCTEYIKNHPLEEYLGVLVDINGQRLPLGLFVWTWKFHNAVNARISKPIMTWETAYNLYSEKENLVCSKNCLDAGGDAPLAPPVNQNNNSRRIPHPVVPPSKTTNQKFRLISVNR